MQGQQFSIKFFLEDPTWIQQEAMIPVFHHWIRSDRLPNKMLIDVADYRHVHNGPGVMIIGHNCHYSMDEAQGRAGLLYSRKRDSLGEAGDKLREALADTLEACRALETDDTLATQPRFLGNEIVIRMMSRLAASNTDEAFNAFEPTLNSVMNKLYPEGFTARRTGEDNGPFEVRVTAAEATDVASLIARLNE